MVILWISARRFLHNEHIYARYRVYGGNKEFFLKWKDL